MGDVGTGPGPFAFNVDDLCKGGGSPAELPQEAELARPAVAAGGAARPPNSVIEGACWVRPCLGKVASVQHISHTAVAKKITCQADR